MMESITENINEVIESLDRAGRFIEKCPFKDKHKLILLVIIGALDAIVDNAGLFEEEKSHYETLQDFIANSKWEE